MAARTLKKTKREPLVFEPNPGPQTEFCACDADICIFGGSVGGGKTIGGLLDLVRWTDRAGFYGLVLRRKFRSLTGPGSIWEKARKIFGASGGHPRQGNALDWRWPSGALIEFNHCQYDKNAEENYQGNEYDAVLFEELTHFTEYQFWYLWGRLRQGSGSGLRPYIRGTCNPDPDSFVRKLIDWWIDPVTGYAIPERSGVKRWFVRSGDEMVWGDTAEEAAALAKEAKIEGTANSLTFIRSSLDDNPQLLANDPEYKTKLNNLPYVERERLLGGNWNIRKQAGTVFKEQWFRFVDQPVQYPLGRVRGWDLAATKPSEKNEDPDWTRGVKMARERNGDVVIEDVVSTRDGPVEVFNLVERTAELDGKSTVIAFFQDPAQAGKSEAERYRLHFETKGYHVVVLPTAAGKIALANPLAVAAEAGKVACVVAEWTKGFISEHHKFPVGKKNDMVDAGSAAHHGLNLRFPFIPNLKSIEQPTTVWSRPRVNYGR